MELTPDIITLFVGTLLSLIFSYVPKLNTAFAKLESDYQRLIMLGLLILTGAGVYGLACANVLGDLTGITLLCDKPGLYLTIRATILAIMANQSAYAISPKTKAVKAVKLAKAGGNPPF